MQIERRAVRRGAAVAAGMLVGLGTLAGGAAAQTGADAGTIAMSGQVGSTRGSIAAGDERANGRGGFDVLTLDAAEGTRYRITVSSVEFDTYLSVARTVGGITDVLASNADGPFGTDAEVVFQPDRPGRYLLIPQAEFADGTGSYEVRVEAYPLPGDAERAEARPGEVVRGELDHRTAQFDGEKYFATYRVPADPGERLSLRLGSIDFDAYLVVADAATGEELVRDDDGAGETDAMAYVSAPSSGELLVTATTYSGLATGRYTLAVEALPPVVSERRAIESGATVTSQLSPRLPVAAEGQFYEEWELTGGAGDRLVVRMESEEIDSFVTLSIDESGTLREIDSNDDGPETTDSLLEVELPEAGSYVVRATSFGAGETGEYTLTVERR